MKIILKDIPGYIIIGAITAIVSLAMAVKGLLFPSHEQPFKESRSVHHTHRGAKPAPMSNLTPLQKFAVGERVEEWEKDQAPAAAARAEQLQEGVAAYYRQDYQTALKILQPLADLGNAGAQETTGEMYEKGQGVKQDYAEAMKWYRKAADQGFWQADGSIGEMYMNGKGVKRDPDEGERWIKKADSDRRHKERL